MAQTAFYSGKTRVFEKCDFRGNSGPPNIDDFNKNRSAGGVYIHHYEKAVIRIRDSNTPKRSAPVGQIPDNTIVD